MPITQGLINRCPFCGLEMARAFLIVEGKCRVCGDTSIFSEDTPKMGAAPEWAPTPNPKIELGTNVWWVYRGRTWVPLPPYEYPTQQLPWLK